MDINAAFPSNYLKAADLQGRSIPVTISRVDVETVGDDRKPIVYFQGKEKGLVLNKTNATTIAMLYGQETDNWSGAAIKIFPTQVDFQGRQVAAIRVRMEPPKQSNTAPAAVAAPENSAPAPHNDQPLGQEIDDEIPF